MSMKQALRDEVFKDVEDTIYEEEVPLYKKILCGNNPLGDWHYNFWKGLDCVCCAFYRGIVVGVVYSALLVLVAKMITG